MKFKLFAAAVSIAASTSALAVPPKLPLAPVSFTPITTTIGAKAVLDSKGKIIQAATGPSVNYIGSFSDSFTLTTLAANTLPLISLAVTGATGSFADTASKTLYKSGLTLEVFNSTGTTLLGTAYSVIGTGAAKNLYTTTMPTIAGVVAGGTYKLVVTGTSTQLDAKFQIQGTDLTVSGGTITPVPEPESYAMFLAGLGLMGAIAKRRKSKQA